MKNLFSPFILMVLVVILILGYNKDQKKKRTTHPAMEKTLRVIVPLVLIALCIIGAISVVSWI